jgi:hypothetical protein
MVNIGQKNGLTKWRFDVFSRAAVAVAARSDLQGVDLQDQV